MIELLKKNREIFLDYQQKTNTNMLLCILGVIPDEETITRITSGGWQPMIAYFPYEKMSDLEINLIHQEHAPSYSIAGITTVETTMVYFVAERIRAGKKMIVEQKNYDHLYHNQPIKVFTTEEDFVNFLCAPDGYCGDGVTKYAIYNFITEYITLSLNTEITKKGGTMQASITEGTLEINPAASLAHQMVV